jgi:hypothetical protein
VFVISFSLIGAPRCWGDAPLLGGIDTTRFQNRHENASIYRFPLFVIVAIKQLNPRD